MSISRRALSTIGVSSDGAKLFAAMAALPRVEGQDIVISAKDARPARKARTRARGPRVGFEVERLPPTVKLNAVRVEEIDPPAGVKPIVWLLLTTHPAETLEDALRIVGRRRARWTIEQVFRVMKSQGFDL